MASSDTHSQSSSIPVLRSPNGRAFLGCLQEHGWAKDGRAVLAKPSPSRSLRYSDGRFGDVMPIEKPRSMPARTPRESMLPRQDCAHHTQFVRRALHRMRRDVFALFGTLDAASKPAR